MKLLLGDEDTPWLLFLLAAVVLAMGLLSSGMHKGHPRPAAATTQQK